MTTQIKELKNYTNNEIEEKKKLYTEIKKLQQMKEAANVDTEIDEIVKYSKQYTPTRPLPQIPTVGLKLKSL